MNTTTPTVRDLRRRWKPHKERLSQAQGDHPTAVRFHRACSWLDQAEMLNSDEQLDLVLLNQWIAFNSIYGQWDSGALEPAADRRSWQAFIGRILALDKSQHVVSVLQDHKPLVLTILEDAYLNRHFWQDPNARTASRARHGRHKALSWYVEGWWREIVEQLLERVYLLRCQLIHGAATFGSRLNRTALKHCATMMGLLMPAILLVWIDHGADEDWGLMCYPPLESTESAKSGVRPLGAR